MIYLVPNPRQLSFVSLCAIGFLLCTLACSVSAQSVVLHLKNGDQISGLVISENTNQVVISNAWAKVLPIPLSEISRREPVTNKKAAKPTPVIAKAKPAPPHAKVAAAKPSPSLKAPVKSKGTWHSQINIGLDALFGTTDQKSYSGGAKFTYLRPYPSQPKKFFRNTFKLGAEYQRTDNSESANNGYVNNKTDLDLWQKSYAYVMAGAGYAEIQKINFQYQFGPGAGLHVIQKKNFVLDTEAGFNYQAQDRRDTSNLESMYFRLAENLTWAIQKKLTLTEHVAFYPNMESLGQYHNHFDSTASYGFWKHLSINLTTRDDYNTELAPGVTPNQFEVRLFLGITF